MILRLVVGLLLLLMAACGYVPGSLPGQPLNQVELKYRIIAAEGTPFACGPPVAREPQVEADQAFPTIQADQATYQAILAHAHPAGDPSQPGFRLAVYREWQKLQAVRLTLSGDAYQFSLQVAPSGRQATLVTGNIDSTGNITNVKKQPSVIMCPICLPAAAAIATPAGPVAVSRLQLGELVWTLGSDGARVAAPVLRLGSVPMPFGHDAVRLDLADGRSISGSAAHPTADGRRLGELGVGSSLDGSAVIAATQIHLDDGGTYDLLPAGPTGDYWADGVLLGSTMHGS